MQFDYLEQWANFNNTAFASMKELGEINAKTIEKLIQQQLEVINLSFDTGMKQINLFSEAKGYKELFSGLAKLVSEYNEKILETVRKTTTILTESQQELSTWAEKGMESTVAPLRKVIAPKRSEKPEKAAA